MQPNFKGKLLRFFSERDSQIENGIGPAVAVSQLAANRAIYMCTESVYKRIREPLSSNQNTK